MTTSNRPGNANGPDLGPRPVVVAADRFDTRGVLTTSDDLPGRLAAQLGAALAEAPVTPPPKPTSHSGDPTSGSNHPGTHHAVEPGGRGVLAIGSALPLFPEVGRFDGGWLLSSSSDPDALAVVDGLGRFWDHGPHYSRRTPGSKTFTGIGQEVVLLHESGAAVWAVVRQRVPSKRGSGASRGRTGTPDVTPFVWRNMLFRRLPECPVKASDLIRSATAATYAAWRDRYGSLPAERLRTEVDTRNIRSTNPGCCYRIAGWTPWKTVRGKLYLLAPTETET